VSVSESVEREVVPTDHRFGVIDTLNLCATDSRAKN
jgi:hypothetical protein